MLVNFNTEEVDNVVMTDFLGEKGWLYYSGLSAQKCRQIVTDSGLELIVDKVKQANNNTGHLWIIGRKAGTPIRQ